MALRLDFSPRCGTAPPTFTEWGRVRSRRQPSCSEKPVELLYSSRLPPAPAVAEQAEGAEAEEGEGGGFRPCDELRLQSVTAAHGWSPITERIKYSTGVRA